MLKPKSNDVRAAFLITSELCLRKGSSSPRAEKNKKQQQAQTLPFLPIPHQKLPP